MASTIQVKHKTNYSVLKVFHASEYKLAIKYAKKYRAWLEWK